MDTLWFDVAIVMSIFAVGSILFGRFDEHRRHGVSGRTAEPREWYLDLVGARRQT